MENIWNDGFSRVLERGMDYSTLRHSVLANNIANANTPGFNRSDVSFVDVMRKKGVSGSDLSASVTHSGHMPLDGSSSQIDKYMVKTDITTARNDKNNVDINLEMTESAKNSVYFQTLTQISSRRFTLIKDVIRGR